MQTSRENSKSVSGESGSNSLTRFRFGSSASVSERSHGGGSCCRSASCRWAGAATSGWTGRAGGHALIGAVLVWGLSLTGFGATSYLPLALTLLALAGLGDLISDAAAFPALRRAARRSSAQPVLARGDVLGLRGSY
jgi:hypothetical protein